MSKSFVVDNIRQRDYTLDVEITVLEDGKYEDRRVFNYHDVEAIDWKFIEKNIVDSIQREMSAKLVVEQKQVAAATLEDTLKDKIGLVVDIK